jgi:hypothetical protein
VVALIAFFGLALRLSDRAPLPIECIPAIGALAFASRTGAPHKAIISEIRCRGEAKQMCSSSVLARLG